MNWKLIWKSLRNREMRSRIFAVLGMLFVFRILAHIPVPLDDPQSLKQILQNLFTSQDSPQLLSFINVLSGGALANLSIMLVGLGPYINSSIIMQLLTKAIPKLESLNKEGEFGRKKINQYTRILTLPLAIVQSVGAIYLIKQSASSIGGLGDITANATLSQWILMVAALTGGAMILMWLGELITEKGIGNGISIIITVGIVSSLPSTIANLLDSVIVKDASWSILGLSLPISKTGLLFSLLITAIVVVVTVFIVRLNEASRNLTVNYAKRVQGNRAYGGVTTRLPIKLITAGVIPIIFALAFLSVPTFAGQLMVGSSSARLQELGNTLVRLFQNPSASSFSAGGWQPYLYPVVYFILVVVFTYFYTNIAFNAKEIAENLQKQGGFLSDIRSGKQTEKYLSKMVNQLTLFGAIALGSLAILPIIAQMFLKTNITIGGTSILILVSVALETLRALESRALMVTYDQFNQPDYFYDSDISAKAKTGARRRIFRRKK